MSGQILLPGNLASVLRREAGIDAAKTPPTERETKLGSKILQLRDQIREATGLLREANAAIKAQHARIAEFESCFTITPIDGGGEALEVDYDRLVVVMYGPAAEIEAVEELPTPPT